MKKKTRVDSKTLYDGRITGKKRHLIWFDFHNLKIKTKVRSVELVSAFKVL